MFGKIVKGDKGYLEKKRIRVIILTAVFFAILLLIFAVGYITTGTKKNLLTVVAILGCLPACKSAVSMIMYIRAKGCSKEASVKIEGIDKDYIGMFDMYFTSYEKNYSVSHMVVNKKACICFTENPKFDADGFKNHIITMMKQAGYSNIVVTVCLNIDKYCEMLKNLNTDISDEEIKKDDAIRISLYEISL